MGEIVVFDVGEEKFVDAGGADDYFYGLFVGGSVKWGY